MPLGTSRGAPPFNRFGVLLGQGAGAPPVSTLAGVANSILYVPSNGARPIWTTSPTFTGNVTFNYVYVNGRLDASAPAGLTNTIRVMPNADDSATGRLVFRELEQNGTQQVSLRAPAALATNVNFVLPAAYGAQGDALFTDAAGGWYFDTAPHRFNWVFNGEFEIWGQGNNAPPTGWNWSAAGIAQKAIGIGVRGGTNCLAITRSGFDCWLGQLIDKIYPPVHQWYYRRLTFGCWVLATVPGAQIVLADGTQWVGSQHSGSGNWEWLTISMTDVPNSPYLQVFCWVQGTNTTAYFDGATLVRGSHVQDWEPAGWRGRKAIIALSTGNQLLSANPTFYGLGRADPAELQANFMAVPFRGVARNLFVVSNMNTNATDTLRLQGAVDTALAVTFPGINYGSNQTTEVEFIPGNLMTMRSTATAGERHTATLEYEEIPLGF